MTQYFAYGSNMCRSAMAARCSQARAIGEAVLAGWRFVITTDGYASIAPSRGGEVRGILWRVTPRDLAALDAYENVAGGLYRRRVLRVRAGSGMAAALVYVGRRARIGPCRPRPGYLDEVVAAARDWRLPAEYCRNLARLQPSGWRGARAPDTGELG